MSSESEHAYYQALELPVETPPQRIVSLVPSMTETLFDLGLGNRLVGRTEYCVLPADKVGVLPIVGGTKNPDVARILELRPDLVIMNQEENRREDAEALQAAGVPVWVTFPKTVQDVLNLLWNIMYAFDETTYAPRVRLIEQTYDWLNTISEARELEAPCKVFVPIWLDPLMTINGDTYVHDVLRVCGGMNVFAERKRLFPLAADLARAEPYAADDPRVQGRDTRYPRVTWEEVEAHQPDVILLPSEPFAFDETHVPLFAKLDVPAARNGRIHLVDGALLTWHGTRVAHAMNTLPDLFQPMRKT